MIAIIPARGGSKGLPGKNIKVFHGKPLISYTIKAAKKSKYIDRVIVSTDDEEIAKISMEYGAEIPFLRPKELATDRAKAIDNYIFTMERLMETEGINIEEFIVLQPTSPLRTYQDIDRAVEVYKKKGAHTVISVNEAEHPPTWYKKINTQGMLVDYIPLVDNSLNRQEEEKSYLPNGAIYIFNFKELKQNYSYYNSKTYPYIMTQENSVDIDTHLDFMLAEIMYEK